MDELIHGCLRLRGDAKQIDLHCLGYTLRDQLNKIMHAINCLEETVLSERTTVAPQNGGCVSDAPSTAERDRSSFTSYVI